MEVVVADVEVEVMLEVVLVNNNIMMAEKIYLRLLVVLFTFGFVVVACYYPSS